MSIRSFHSVPATGWMTPMSSNGPTYGGRKREPNENKITAPAGREVIIPSRRVYHPLPHTISKQRLIQGLLPHSLRMATPDSPEQGFTAGGGAGNAFKKTETTEESQKEAQELLTREREVLEKHKAQVGPDFKTGRGGLGAKGHVKVKGMTPNRERALEKERVVRERWKERKEVIGGGRYGRGGYNVVKANNNNLESDSKSTSSKSRSSSGRAAQKMFYEVFIVSSEERRRRREFPSHYTGSAPSLRSTHPYSQSSRSDRWEMASTSDSIYDIEASTGITTSVVDPAVVLGAMSPHAYSGAPSPIATSAPHTEEPIIGARCPSDVAPFVEPLDVNRHANIQRRVTSNVITQPPTPTTITTTASALPSISTTTNKNEKQATTTTTTTKSFIRSLKGLTLHRPKEDKRVTTTTMTTTTETTTTKPWDIPFGSRPPNDVYYSGSHSGRSTSSSSAASIALQMLDPSNREMARIPTNESTRQPYISTQVISVDKGDDTASKASVTWTSTASTSAISTTSSMSSAYYPSHYAPSSLPSSSNVTIVAFPPPPLPPPTIPPPTNPVRRSRPLPTPPVAHPPLTHGLPSPPNTPV